MAVYKALRTESNVQFVETARKLALCTRRNCIKMPKRLTFFGGQKLCAMADDVYALVKSANSDYPTNAHEAQLRRDYLTKANAQLQAFIGQLSLMVDVLAQSNPKWLEHATEEWAMLAADEAKLISATKKADAQRYKNFK